MVSLAKKTIKKNGGAYAYYQIVESVRVNGKPRPNVLIHLGTPEKILKTYVEYKKLKKRLQDE